MENVGIYLGTTPESIKATQEAVMAVLEARADEKTKRAALKTIREASGTPSNNSISGCSIMMEQPRQDYDAIDPDYEPNEDDDPEMEA